MMKAKLKIIFLVLAITVILTFPYSVIYPLLIIGDALKPLSVSITTRQREDHIESEARKLKAARTQWEANNPGNYVVTLEIGFDLDKGDEPSCEITILVQNKDKESISQNTCIKVDDDYFPKQNDETNFGYSHYFYPVSLSSQAPSKGFTQISHRL